MAVGGGNLFLPARRGQPWWLSRPGRSRCFCPPGCHRPDRREIFGVPGLGSRTKVSWRSHLRPCHGCCRYGFSLPRERAVIRNQQSTSPDAAAFAPGADLPRAAATCVFARALPVTRTASAGVVPRAVAWATPGALLGGGAESGGLQGGLHLGAAEVSFAEHRRSARPQGPPHLLAQGTGFLFVDKVNSRPTASVYPFTGGQTEAESRATAVTRTTPVDSPPVGRPFVDSENGNAQAHRSSYFPRFSSYRRLETSDRPLGVGA